jgi:hypothetical protein
VLARERGRDRTVQTRDDGGDPGYTPRRRRIYDTVTESLTDGHEHEHLQQRYPFADLDRCRRTLKNGRAGDKVVRVQRRDIRFLIFSRIV